MSIHGDHPQTPSTPPPPCGATAPTTPGRSGLAHHHTHTCARPTMQAPHPGAHHCGGCGATFTVGTVVNQATPMVVFVCHACGTEQAYDNVREEYDANDEVAVYLCRDTDACIARVRGKLRAADDPDRPEMRAHIGTGTPGGGAKPGQGTKDGPTPGRPFLSRDENISPGKGSGPFRVVVDPSMPPGDAEVRAGRSRVRITGLADAALATPDPVSGYPAPCDDPNPSAQWVRCTKVDGHDGWHEALGVMWAAATGKKPTTRPVQSAADAPTAPGAGTGTPETPTDALGPSGADGPGPAIRAGWVGVEIATSDGPRLMAPGDVSFIYPDGPPVQPDDVGREDVRAIWDRMRSRWLHALEMATPGPGLGSGWVPLGATDAGHTATTEVTTELVQTMPDDVAERLDAGHNLAAALYYDRGPHGSDADKTSRWWTHAGNGVMEAYGHACDLFRIGAGRRHGRDVRVDPFNRGRCLGQNGRGRQCYMDHGHEGMHR